MGKEGPKINPESAAATEQSSPETAILSGKKRVFNLEKPNTGLARADQNDEAASDGGEFKSPAVQPSEPASSGRFILSRTVGDSGDKPRGGRLTPLTPVPMSPLFVSPSPAKRFRLGSSASSLEGGAARPVVGAASSAPGQPTSSGIGTALRRNLDRDSWSLRPWEQETARSAGGDGGGSSRDGRSTTPRPTTPMEFRPVPSSPGQAGPAGEGFGFGPMSPTGLEKNSGFLNFSGVESAAGGTSGGATFGSFFSDNEEEGEEAEGEDGEGGFRLDLMEAEDYGKDQGNFSFF